MSPVLGGLSVGLATYYLRTCVRLRCDLSGVSQPAGVMVLVEGAGTEIR
ncbi:hypothetical protein [Nocardia veterana]|uniref:Uncharacterized protein n=1 Tax=Nocardia veterana TaxID=132249 RepID=A0A7X6LWV9_9NOCA|nr:hypothetical protein [Nocardia veterana]NKY85636.1 hypothetical protein [Nocardia veterana]